jgi:biotin carboxyl carrier protein
MGEFVLTPEEAPARQRRRALLRCRTVHDIQFAVTSRRRVALPTRSRGFRPIQAEEGNGTRIAAPVAGSISTVAVRAGQPVKAGDVLLTIELMKMETALHAPRDGVVKEVLVHAASPIDAKDLLVVLD